MYVQAWHFVGETLFDDSPIPPDGEWLEVEPPLKLCRRGLHGSRKLIDALAYAPGETLCFCEYDGKIVEDDDKLCASRRRIVWRIDATDILWRFTRLCALDVAHLWDMPDVFRQYLETGDESLNSAAKIAAYAVFATAVVSNNASQAAALAAAWAIYIADNAAHAAARAAPWAAYAASQGVLLKKARVATKPVMRTIINFFSRTPCDTGKEWDAAREMQNQRLTDMVHAARGGNDANQ